jgi:adenosylcobyric acid synthase
MTARALMILGTASHVGKSILTAALGRIFSDEGYRVAPFKAQNMSLNSAATPDGREIGRAQALQAEACRVAARAEMNPILLKPSSDHSSQVIVLGRVWGQVSAADYHLRRVEDLFPMVVESYEKLASEHDIILLEGAGSPAEINLKERDIVNMRMAQAANAACILVGDIDRGGVFASLLGTLELLDAQERARIRGFLINKFRGDVSLLQPGIEMISARIGIPCAGVVPWLRDMALDEEDSVSLPERRMSWPREEPGPQRALRIGVIAFPHLANFTDFDALAAEPSVSLAFLDRPGELATADLVILPGSKQTLDDLDWLNQRGFIEPIQQFRGSILGICGGMQMLGRSIDDPHGAENQGTPRSAPALGLLPIRTILAAEKITRPVRGQVAGLDFRGYEIHLGETVYETGASAFSSITRAGEECSRADGAVNGRVSGTYVHGLFDDDAFRRVFLADARAKCGLAPAQRSANFSAERERRIDRLASHVRGAIDLGLIKRWLEMA